MKHLLCIFTLGICSYAAAQEASSGFDMHATLSGQVVGSNELTEAPRLGNPAAIGYRAVFYPTWKISDHWMVNAALQSYSHPYFYDSFSTAGYGVRDNILQASVAYSRVSDKGSLLVRAGELTTSFGSFPLHYDDADNPLVEPPLEYGYYYQPVSTLPVAGAQIDVTRGKVDARVQFANSSPVNPRGLFKHDQYGNWAAGGGYTIRQGFRVGVSTFRGPYLYRGFAYYFPGEANPNKLAARAAGVDAQWSHGHWNIQGEWQTFVMPYKLIPTFREQAGYIEAKRVLNARWYVAARSGYIKAGSTDAGVTQKYEATVGFRTNRFQVIKVGYGLERQGLGQASYDNSAAVQVVTSFRMFSFGKSR